MYSPISTLGVGLSRGHLSNETIRLLHSLFSLFEDLLDISLHSPFHARSEHTDTGGGGPLSRSEESQHHSVGVVHSDLNIRDQQRLEKSNEARERGEGLTNRQKVPRSATLPTGGARRRGQPVERSRIISPRFSHFSKAALESRVSCSALTRAFASSPCENRSARGRMIFSATAPFLEQGFLLRRTGPERSAGDGEYDHAARTGREGVFTLGMSPPAFCLSVR